MDNRSNLTSYEGTESFQIGLNKEALNDYLNLKLKSAEDNVKFIENNNLLYGKNKIVEIGGGNGKLLFALERKGFLEEAINYEVSKSRCELSLKFKEILGSEKVEIRNKNFLEDKISDNSMDLIIGVDIVYQLVAPLYDSAEEEMIEWIYNALKDNGILLLELIDYDRDIANIREKGVVREWNEFPVSDPYRYSLNKNLIDKDGNIVIEKTFIKRDDGSLNRKKDVIKSVSREHIKTILNKKGFDVQIFSNESEIDLEYENSMNQYRVVARKIK